MIDLAALIQETGDALEGSAGFPAFPNEAPERKSQAIDAESFFRFSRIFRSENECTGSGTDPINSEAGLPHENGVRIGRAHEVTWEERKTRKTRTNPCSIGASPFPFLERETEKAETLASAGGLPMAPFDAEDWRAAFDERAGILEFDAGLPRAEAERLALQEITALHGPEPDGSVTTMRTIR